MKKTAIISAFVFVSALFSSGISAKPREGADPFMLPQVGAWFGPVTPVYETWGMVDTTIGGGAYARLNIFNSPFKICVDGSYQRHKSKGVNGLTLVPVYGSLMFRLPINSVMSYQLRLGAGGCYIKMLPDEVSQWDPLFVIGTEFSFPAGTLANVGLRVDYHLLYEKRIPGAKRNGHFVDIGISFNFNLDPFN